MLNNKTKSNFVISSDMTILPTFIQMKESSCDLQISTALHTHEPSSSHICISDAPLATFQTFLIMVERSEFSQRL